MSDHLSDALLQRSVIDDVIEKSYDYEADISPLVLVRMSKSDLLQILLCHRSMVM